MTELKVETYECPEVSAEPLEASEEAQAIITSLGLKGQRTMVAEAQAAIKQRERNPYRKITAAEDFAYRVLCPTASKIEDYDSGPIPLRVLQIAAHAKQLGVFEELHVWHKSDAPIPDPVLVGIKARDGSTWNKDTFILARWGSELETFATLLRQALKQKRDELKASAQEVVAKAKAYVDMIDKSTDDRIIECGHGGDVTISAPYALRKD